MHLNLVLVQQHTYIQQKLKDMSNQVFGAVNQQFSPITALTIPSVESSAGLKLGGSKPGLCPGRHCRRRHQKKI